MSNPNPGLPGGPWVQPVGGFSGGNSKSTINEAESREHAQETKVMSEMHEMKLKDFKMPNTTRKIPRRDALNHLITFRSLSSKAAFEEAALEKIADSAHAEHDRKDDGPRKIWRFEP